MDACVGAPHLSRNLKPTVTIRDWSRQNMTRVRFARKVQDYALAVVAEKVSCSLLKGAFALTVFALLFLFAGILPHIVSRIRWSSLPDAFLVGYAVACRCADTGSARGLCPA